MALERLGGPGLGLNRCFWLRSRIGVVLDALYESLPQYTEEDLLICHRQNSKGTWRAEVWTNRAFAANELALAPFSSQVKDTHLTAAANAVVGLPVHGRGKHPDGWSLALDGRTRTSIAKAGTIDEQDHVGSLFWVVTRTTTASEANLVMEPMLWNSKVELKLPAKKRKVHVEWEADELPTIPLMTNKAAVKQKTLLKVFVEEKKEEKKGTPEKKTT